MGNKGSLESSEGASGHSSSSGPQNPRISPLRRRPGAEKSAMKFSDPFLEARSAFLDASRIASLSWDDFLRYMSSLNEKCRHLVDSRGKYLLFAIKKGTHDTYLWKATVKICCLKMNSNTGKVESRKFLTLPQFLRLHSSLVYMLNSPGNTETTTTTTNSASSSAEETPVKRRLSLDEPSPSHSVGAEGDSRAGGSVSDTETCKPQVIRSLAEAKEFGASILLERIDLEEHRARASDIESNCIICMERKPDVLLPCTHCYCLPCIEQWNDGHRWCPICRRKIDSTDDAWVISDFPDQEDFTDYLLTLADEQQ